ncbi:MAG: adenine deaminase C-terminal domain-containing protein [Lachnospiraceae bacterium]|nr:adenine deaminase C-terminal domain-containing protein [Lachnospiraceae bacterium]
MNQKLLNVSSGKAFADTAVVNGQIVNVFTGEIYPGGVAICGDTIAAVGDISYCIGPDTAIIDAQNHYLTPGFIDGHIHPESSNLSIRNFAAAIQTHGTSTIMTDLHEIGVVAGIDGIRAILEEAKETSLNIYWIVPSHIPCAPNLETSAYRFHPEIISRGLEYPDAVGISEISGFSVISGNDELLESIDLCANKNLSLQGHLAGISGKNLTTCIAAGVVSDHEAITEEEALERLRTGCHLMMREGSVAHNLKVCLQAIKDHKLDTSNTSIVTDDLHVCDAVKKGHLDESIRVALKEGIDFTTAIQMVTINAAKMFHVEHQVGILAPGRRADINITSGPEDFKVLSVISAGKLWMKDQEILKHYSPAIHAPILLNTMHLKREISPKDFEIHVTDGRKQVQVIAMKTESCALVTSPVTGWLNVRNGIVECDVNQDILYIAQIERHGKNGQIGKAFMSGFQLKSGAIACTIGHDNHNIIVLGTNFDDMALAANRLNELQGGQIVVNGGEILSEIAYPICGLLSDLPAEELAAEKEKANRIIQNLSGETSISIPFMVLSFICLAVIPEFAVTDFGFIDVLNEKVIDPIIG